MNTETAAATAPYNLRVARGTTGVVHAAREEQSEILNFNSATYAERFTGTYRTITVKACGGDSNTLRRVSGVTDTDATAEVTCKKCIKATA